MKIYLVGGAVRDQLLNLPVKERDFVVVGATVEEMLHLGYQQVGKDFPVFLHPETKEEYALARIERKTGRGYTNFSFDTSPHVTLEEDLKRRDITINAMAQSSDGQLIDPYHGKIDLQKKILRHVSNAFVEDPVRILRVGRFAARFAELGFSVAPETVKLMRDMVKAGEVDALVAERVWKEWERALTESNPEKFFEVLAACDADKVLFGSFVFSIDALMNAKKITSDPVIRFAVLLHMLSIQEIKTLCERYRIPTEYKELAVLVSQYLGDYKNIQQHESIQQLSEKIVKILYATDAFRREDRFNKFLTACAICASAAQADLFKKCYIEAKAVSAKEFVDAGLSGKEIAEKMYEKRRWVCELVLRDL